jgi:phenylalanyl-tRNA synthetase beta chain
LTSIGLEVESIDTHESIKGGLDKFFIGEVMTCVKHPNADKLSLTEVNLGTELGTRKIVCGAPNVAAGQKVVVATEGAVIYLKDGESYTIKNSKIRGEESCGMICAEDELGIGDSHAGILVLDNSVEVGIPAAQHFQLTSDTVFEIGLTPNRTDALCHRGI